MAYDVIGRSQGYVWDVSTLAWVKMEQPVIDGGSITISGTITVQATDLDIRNLTAPTDSVAIGDGSNTATIRNLAANDALNVAIVDAAGDQITTFGNSVQYTEGDVDPSITGTVAMMEGAGNTLLPVQGTVADGLLVNLGTNNDVVASATDLDIRDLSKDQDSVLVYGSDDGGTTKRVVKTDATGAVQTDIESLPTQTASGSFTTVEDAVTLALAGEANTAFQITGVWTGVISFEASLDNSNWVAIWGYQAGTTTIAQATTVNGLFRCTTAGFKYVRARYSTDSGGTAVVTAHASHGTSGVFVNFPEYGAQMVGKQEDIASAGGDVGAAVLVVQKATPADTADTDGDYAPLQMSGGRLWVDASGKTLTVAGTVSVTEPVTVDAVDLDIRNLVFATDKVDASGTALGTNSGVDIGDVTVNNAAGASAVNIQDGGNSITVDATSLPLPAGAATEGTLASILTIDGFTGATFATNTDLLFGSVVSAGRVIVGYNTALDAYFPIPIASVTPPVSSATGVVVRNQRNDLTPSAPTVASVGVASAQAVAANGTRKGLMLRNLSTTGQRISLGFGSAAVLDSGVTLFPQDVFSMDEYDFDLGAVNAIASAAAQPLAVQEYLT